MKPSLQRQGKTKALDLFRFLPLFLAGLLLSAFPVKAANFEETYNQANKSRAEGRFEDAEQQYREALDLSPENADVLLQLGLVLGFLERHEEALVILKQGLAVAPEYTDLAIAAARIKIWAGRLVEAEEDVVGILDKNPGNAEALKLRQQLAGYRDEATKTSLRFDLGYDQSRFGRVSRKDWHEGYAQITYGTKQTQGHIRTERGRRFGEFDTYIRTGIAHRLNKGLGGYVSLGITPAATFYPRWKMETGVDYRLLDSEGMFGPTIAKLDLTQKDYATGDIRNIDPGLQQYIFDGQAWLTGRWINTYDLKQSKRHPGWSFRGDWQALDTFRVFGGIASSAETESGTSVVTLSRYAGTSLDVGPDMGLNFAFTRDNRKNSYIRDVFSAGMSFRF